MAKTRLVCIIRLLLLLCSYTAAQSFTAPALLLPTLGDTIYVANPAFSWQAAYPAGGLQYEFRLYELLGDQSPQAAILSSPLLHATGTGQATTYLYPFNAAELKPGHHYAWQVVVHPMAEGQNEVYSPVNHFWVSDVQPDDIMPPKVSTYFEPHVQSNQRTYELQTSWLPIVLDEKYRPSQVTFRLISETRDAIKIPNRDVSVDTEYGDNYIQIYVGKLKPGIYEAIIETRKSTVQYVRFRVVQ